MEGFTVSFRPIARIRRNMNLIRRFSVFEQAQQKEYLREIVKAELDIGEIEGYGHGLLYTYFCTKGVLVSRFVKSFIYNEISTNIYIEGLSMSLLKSLIQMV